MKYMVERVSISNMTMKPCVEAHIEEVINEQSKSVSVWVVELITLSDLLNFMRKYEQVVVRATSFKDILFKIEIYDTFRE